MLSESVDHFECQWCFSRVFQGSFKGILRKFQGYCKSVARVFQESCIVVTWKFQGRFKGALRKFYGCFNEDLRGFKEVSRLFQEIFKDISWKFHGGRSFKDVSWFSKVVPECLNGVSRKFQENFQSVSKSFMLHGTHRSFPSRRRACLYVGPLYDKNATFRAQTIVKKNPHLLNNK